MTYEKGLRDLGNGCWAWLQPDGSWGWSNAGLIADGDSSLLVDTLFDLHLTREMLAAMQDVTGRAPIRTLVNTHANGDHCWGNQLVTGAEIIGSTSCAAEMGSLDPGVLAAMLKSDDLGDAGAFFKRIFGAFDFEGITLTRPTRTFDGALSITVVSSLLHRETAIQRDYLGSSALATTRPPARLLHQAMGIGFSSYAAPLAVRAALGRALGRAANVRAYQNLYFLIGLVVATSLVPAFFLTKINTELGRAHL